MVLVEHSTKYDTGYALKTMDQLLSFRALAANIKYVYSIR